MRNNARIFGITMPIWLIGLISVIAIAGVIFGIMTMTATVHEPLSVSPTSIVYDLYAGESKSTVFTITNLADVAEKAMISYVETENVNGVTYTVLFTPATQDILSLGSSTIDANVTVDSDSKTGILKLNFTVTRIA